VTSDLAALLWPLERKDEVARVVARAREIGRAASPEWFPLRYEDVAPGAPPALESPSIVRVEPLGDVPGGWLAVVRQAPGRVVVAAPDGQTHTVPEDAVGRFLVAASAAPVAPGVARVLARAALPATRTEAVRVALVGAALSGERVAEGFRVRAASGTFAAALRRSGLLGRLAFTSLAYGAQLALLVVVWWMVGARAAGASAADAHASGPGALPFVVVIVAFVGAHFLAAWCAGRLALDAGRFLRTRLMDGLLALDTEPLRAEGIGQLLGRVMETEAVESLALGGGLLTVAGLFELATGVVVLAAGARAGLPLALLSLVLAAGAALAAVFWRSLRRWSALRIALTHDLVERMVGHRTLVAQQPPSLRHREEDRALDAYAVAGRGLDRAAAALAVVVPRGWLFAGLATLAPAVVAAAGGSVASIATTLGGVVVIYGALRKLTQAFPALATAAIAWRQVAPLFAGADLAGAAASTPQGPAPATTAAPPGVSPVLVAAREIGFRYPGRTQPAIADCSFEIRRGDRVLLEGASGGGKSTLATLIAGLRAPDVGTLSLDGVDQVALGLPRWRERAGVVPQFHENHVFSASVLFNLLMGRAWPPRREDLAEAEAVCRELELGGLLARMPSGMEQLIGESGWQLSHGERSRLFIARALLQRLDLRVLDESFAALDPETLERVLGCVLARAETLVVIAHP
jgi:ATP-binding cassette, subfamily B, bacterial